MISVFKKYKTKPFPVIAKLTDVSYIVSIIILFIFFSSVSYGQQSQPYTQYLFNRFLLNPAACAANGFTSAGLITKNQWAGLEGAPMNQVLTAQIRTPQLGFFGTGIRRSNSGFSLENIGLGFALFNDMRGPIRTTGGQFTYAYHIDLQTGQLSFGLSNSLFQLFIDRDKILTENPDKYIDANKLSSFIPEAATGMHYANRDLYVGFSVSNLFQSYLTFGGRSSSDYMLQREYFLIGGYIFELGHEWNIVPATQLKFTERGAAQIDINAMMYYFNKIWFGLSFRTGGRGIAGSTSAMFGIRHNEFFFGYAFDYNFSDFQSYSYGSHELMLSYAFCKSDQFYRYNKRYEFQEKHHYKKFRPGGRFR